MKIKKVLWMFVVIIIILFNSYSVFAAKSTKSSITEQGKNWLKMGEENQNTTLNELNQSADGFRDLAGILTGIGIFVIAIIGVILGIRLMYTSAEGKAKAKEALIIYLVGSVIIIGALGIWKLLLSILDGDWLY